MSTTNYLDTVNSTYNLTCDTTRNITDTLCTTVSVVVVVCVCIVPHRLTRARHQLT